MINFHAVGNGVSIYSGFFQITAISQIFDTFIFLLGALAILPWPSKEYSLINLLTVFYMKDVEKKDNISLYDTTHRVVNLPYNFNTPLVEFPLFVLFTIIGGSLLVSSADIISLYLCIELQSYGVYLYSGLFREKETGVGAALKYYLLGSLSSCFILLGGVLIYVYTGLTHFDALYSFISVTGDYLLFFSLYYDYYFNILAYLGHYNQIVFSTLSIGVGVILGVVFLLYGFLFKISAAPFHSWAPDVYDGTPTIITTWLTILPKLAIFGFLLEFISGLFITYDSLSIYLLPNNMEIYNLFSYFIFEDTYSSDIYNMVRTFFTIGDQEMKVASIFLSSGEENLLSSVNVVQNLILLTSLLSLIIGTVVGLSQVKIKRLLTFSTISHVGFLLLTLSLNTESSVKSFIFYLFQYSLTSLDVFFILLSFGYIYYQRNHIKNLLILVNNEFSGKEKENNFLIQSKKFIVTDISLIEELKGFVFVFPLLVISFSICLFSMAGD